MHGSRSGNVRERPRLRVLLKCQSAVLQVVHGSGSDTPAATYHNLGARCLVNVLLLALKFETMLLLWRIGKH